MKYFKESSDSTPMLEIAKRKVIADREQRILKDIKMLNKMKKVDPSKVSRDMFMRYLREGVGFTDF